MVLSGVTYGNRANSPAPFRSDRKTPAIFRIAIAPIEDRSIEGRCRLSVCPCRRSTNARSRPRSNHLPGIGDRSIANNGHSMDILGNCDDDVEQAAGAGAGLASFRVSDLSEREGERRHSIPIPRLPSACAFFARLATLCAALCFLL